MSLSIHCRIKRPYRDSVGSTIADPRNLLLTLNDIPPANPAIPFACLLQSIEDLCQSSNTDQGKNILSMICNIKKICEMNVEFN